MANINAPVKFVMLDGEIECSLSFANLLKLRQKSKKLWDRCNEIQHMSVDQASELEYVELIYIAYLANCLGTGEDDRYGSFEEFVQFVPDDRDPIAEAHTMLTNPKKAKASVPNS